MSLLDEKLRTVEALTAERGTWRAAGLVTVLANGAFDLLHVGHLRYLEAARELGDRLVVAVNSDASVRSYKGPGRPVLPSSERLEILSHLQVVDRLCLFEEATVAELLAALRPDIHAKGTDYSVDTVPEREVVAAYGGRTAICGDPKNHATTDIIATILDRFAEVKGET
jgi:rfaE bifunctional protein nucleotidyltransferase chain/domain